MEKFQPSFSLRVQRSAQVLSDQSNASVTQETLLKALKTAGIDESHAMVLDSPSVTVEDLVEVLTEVFDLPKLLLKAAAGYLKAEPQLYTLGIGVPGGPGTYTTSTETTYYPTAYQGTSEYLVTSQMPDRELLNKFSKQRDPQSYEELYHRSKDRPFIVLQQVLVGVGEHEYVVPGREVINIDSSLTFLKACRKRGTSMYMVSDNSSDAVIPIYRISEIWMGNRVVHLCPVCDAALCRSYCCHCQVDFSNVGPEERSFLSFICDELSSVKGWSPIPSNEVLDVLKSGKEITFSYLKSVWPEFNSVRESLLASKGGSKPSLEDSKNRLTIFTRCPSYMVRKMPAGN